MRDVYIIEATRSPIGKRGGPLSAVQPADLLGMIQSAAIARAGIDPSQIGQVIGGCVSQIGEQCFNVSRLAWLSQGLPMEVAATTIDSQCGSSQQATSLAHGLIGSGIEDVVMACGIEMMTRVPLGSNMAGGSPMTQNYLDHYEATSQFGGAEMIADEYGISRDDCDQFGLRSQTLANEAWEAGRFDREVVPIEAPELGEDGSPTGGSVIVDRDGGLRETTIEKLRELKPVPGNNLHTAGSSSQISDGASAVILASEDAVKALGVKPRARIAASALVGCDPVSMLKGPIPATEKVLKTTGLKIDEIDVFEVNEAFASVVLAWQKACEVPVDRVNPNGGAIALGHPTGCTGARLITTALHELERIGGRNALISMCCGGGLGTGTILERA